MFIPLLFLGRCIHLPLSDLASLPFTPFQRIYPHSRISFSIHFPGSSNQSPQLLPLCSATDDQGLVHMGKGTIGLNPFYHDGTIMSHGAMAGLLSVIISFTDAKSCEYPSFSSSSSLVDLPTLFLSFYHRRAVWDWYDLISKLAEWTWKTQCLSCCYGPPYPPVILNFCSLHVASSFLCLPHPPVFARTPSQLDPPHSFTVCPLPRRRLFIYSTFSYITSAPPNLPTPRRLFKVLMTVVLKDNHWMLYWLVTAMYPQFLITLDENDEEQDVTVRVGQAVNTVGLAGTRSGISGVSLWF